VGETEESAASAPGIDQLVTNSHEDNDSDAKTVAQRPAGAYLCFKFATYPIATLAMLIHS
jgi:hypothetical protein